jgi:hypothetical protein
MNLLRKNHPSPRKINIDKITHVTVVTQCHAILLKLTLPSKINCSWKVKYCPAISTVPDSSKKNYPTVLWKTDSNTVTSLVH